MEEVGREGKEEKGREGKGKVGYGRVGKGSRVGEGREGRE